MAVIGGGPTGSQVAYRLAGMGYWVVVVEQKARLGEPVCCTGIISQECVRSFAIDESVVWRRVNSARVFSPAGKLLRLWRPEPQACIVDRAAFNATLARRAQAQGAEYRLSSPVRSIKVGSDSVSLEITHHRDGTNILSARAVVLATGFGSPLVERLGLGKVGDFVGGVQAEVATTGVDEVEVYLGQTIAPAFFAWLVPTASQRALVGLMSRRNQRFYLQKLISSLQTQGKIASASAEFSYSGIPLKPLARTYSARLIVVGSAAGQVKPTTGGGIYYGLLCADMAANTLHRALASDTLSARSMAHYEREWQKKLGRELKIGYWARKLYERLSDSQIDRLFDIIKSHGIDDALLQAGDLSFDWHGGVVLRLLGHQVLAKAIDGVKIPFARRGRGWKEPDNQKTSVK